MPTPHKPPSTPSRTGGLHPEGTARALFLAGAAQDADQALPRGLWEQLRARDVSAATLLAAWEACRWVTAAPTERRALACLLVALGEAVESGGAFLPLHPDPRDDDEGLALWLPRLGLGEADRKAVLELAAALTAGRASPGIAALFGAPDARRPFVLDGDRLFPEVLATAERRLATLLAARLRARPAQRGILLSLEASPTRAASPEQRAAVEACLTHPLTLVTGGPGTGKTSIIVTVLRALGDAGVAPHRIAVAAPTGRAAQRIEESIQAAGLTFPDGALAPSVSTLHRLLGVRPARQPTLDAETPEFHAGWRLPHQVVLVDEASMIDLFLMTELLSALADDARLILLGDADQLPAVRLGAVFRDLCAVLPERTCRLTRSFRMDPSDPAGAAILRAAQELGQPGAAPSAPLADAAAVAFLGVEHVVRAALPVLLRRWYDEVLGGDAGVASLATITFTAAADGTLTDDPNGALAAVVARHAAARLLCLTRVADSTTGTRAVNTLLHQFMVRAVAPHGLPADATTTASLLPGEPVAVVRNDYDRSLWNGDQGVVVSMAGPAGRTRGVAFARAGRIVLHPLDELTDNIELAFALTVHKAQGSEYDRIAVLLPSTDGPLLSREILYTALTRARRGVVIVGDPALFALGATRRLRRASGLADKLATTLRETSR